MSIVEEQEQTQPQAVRVPAMIDPEDRTQRTVGQAAPTTAEAGFDIGADLDAAPEVEIGVVKVHVRDKNGKLRYYVEGGESLPVTVTIHNSYTQRAQKIDAQMRRDKVHGRVTYQTLFERQMYKLAQCTTDWEGIVDAAGRPKPFSRAEIKSYYAKNPFLRKDALEAMEDEEGQDFSET